MLFRSRYRVSPRIGAAKQLAEFIAANPGPGIVYCPTRDGTERMAEKLAAATGRPVAAYHAGLDSERRARVQHDFVASEGGIVTAAVAFGTVGSASWRERGWQFGWMYAGAVSLNKKTYGKKTGDT